MVFHEVIPDGYLSLRGAVEYVTRWRARDAVAALTPEGFKFFAALDAMDLSRNPRPRIRRRIRMSPAPHPSRRAWRRESRNGSKPSERLTLRERRRVSTCDKR